MFNILGKKKTKIKVVSDLDLVPYLTSLGIYEKIKKGEILCKFCGNKIDLDNLQALFPCGGGEEICFICNNTKCLIQSYHD